MEISWMIKQAILLISEFSDKGIDDKSWKIKRATCVVSQICFWIESITCISMFQSCIMNILFSCWSENQFDNTSFFLIELCSKIEFVKLQDTVSYDKEEISWRVLYGL